MLREVVGVGRVSGNTGEGGIAGSDDGSYKAVTGNESVKASRQFLIKWKFTFFVMIAN